MHRDRPYLLLKLNIFFKTVEDDGSFRLNISKIIPLHKTKNLPLRKDIPSGIPSPTDLIVVGTGVHILNHNAIVTFKMSLYNIAIKVRISFL